MDGTAAPFIERWNMLEMVLMSSVKIENGYVLNIV